MILVSVSKKFNNIPLYQTIILPVFETVLLISSPQFERNLSFHSLQELLVICSQLNGKSC